MSLKFTKLPTVDILLLSSNGNTVPYCSKNIYSKITHFIIVVYDKN